MRVTARLFAVLREKAGASEVTLEVEEGSTASQATALLLQRFPQLRPFADAVLLAVNAGYVDGSHPLAEGDELALIPPVSGGGRRAQVTEAPLDVEAIAAAVRNPAHGAVVTFEGIVREENLGRRVSFLEYEAFAPMAEAEMERIAQEAEARWGPLSVAIAHRMGRLEIGEVSLVVAVASPHRAEAFESCRYIVDHVKERAPIWKKEVWEGGGEWIGLAHGAAS